MNLFFAMSIALLAGCSTASSWNMSAMATGDLAFDSSRLRFLSSQPHSPLCFEVVKYGERINAFLSLNRFRFSSSPILIQLFIEENVLTEEASVHEGGMRVKLSEAATERVIQALQNGVEVGILIDGFEERLTPGRFPDEFNL